MIYFSIQGRCTDNSWREIRKVEVPDLSWALTIYVPCLAGERGISIDDCRAIPITEQEFKQ